MSGLVTPPRRFTVDFLIADANWLSSNGGRPHWADERTKKATLRSLGAWKARQLRLPLLGVSTVEAFVTPRTHGRFDPNNAHPTTKPLIDGMTDYGVWVDDDSSWVQGPHHFRGVGVAPKGYRQVRFVITELGDPPSVA